MLLCKLHDNHVYVFVCKRRGQEAQQLALTFEIDGAFKVKHKGGKGKQIFGR